MANLTIELATGYTFSATDCGVIPHVVSVVPEVATVLNVVGKLSEPGALDAMKVYNAEDVLLMEYDDVVCDGFQCVCGDENVTLHLYLRERTRRADAGTESEKAGVYDILFGGEEEE